MAEEMHKSDFLSGNSRLSSKKLDKVKGIGEHYMFTENTPLLSPEIIKAIYLSDRTEQSIIENIVNSGESEEKAKKIFIRLHSDAGIIFSRDGVHYYFVEEDALR